MMIAYVFFIQFALGLKIYTMTELVMEIFGEIGWFFVVVWICVHFSMELLKLLLLNCRQTLGLEELEGRVEKKVDDETLKIA